MRLRVKLILGTVVAGALLVGGLRFALNGFVVSRAARALHERYGLDVAIADLSLSLTSGRARLTGVRITDRGSPFIEAEEIEVSASLRDLASATYDLHTLVIRRPMVRLVIEEGHTTNFSRIFGPRAKPEQAAKSEGSAEPAGPGAYVRFRDARIDGGQFALEDSVTDPEQPAHIVFHHLTLRATELQVSGKARDRGPADLRIDGLLTQDPVPARLSVVAWAPPERPKPTYALHIAITGLDLGKLKPYASRSARSALGGDILHLVGTLVARRGEIAEGGIAAHVVETGNDLSLKIGGTTSDLVFDEKSKLTTVIHLPFARIGHAGDVALASTWGATQDVGMGVYDAGKSVVGGVTGTVDGMVHLDPLGALSAAGGGVVGGVKDLGEGLFGGVGRLFGKGDEPVQDADVDAEFAKLHARWRLKMLQGAMESAKKSPEERRARIEEEIEEATRQEAERAGPARD